MIEPMDSMPNTQALPADELNNLRKASFRRFLPKLNARLGVTLKAIETNAAAFVFDMMAKGGNVDENAILTSIFSGEEQVRGRDARKRLMDAVHTKSAVYIAELLAQTSDVSKRATLNALENLIESTYKANLQVFEQDGDFEIGAVPQDWIPAWL